MEFGLALAALWFPTLAGIMGLIIAFVEAFKRIAPRFSASGESESGGEEDKEEPSEEELVKILGMAAVAAYIEDEGEQVGQEV